MRNEEIGRAPGITASPPRDQPSDDGGELRTDFVLPRRLMLGAKLTF